MQPCHRLLWAILIASLVTAAPALAGGGHQRIFTVLRDGTEIGEHSFTFDDQGAAMTVDVKTALAVKVAFITVFRFEHERQERWEEGRLLSLKGKTHDDGDDYVVEIAAANGSYRWTVNGASRQLANPLMPVTLWNQAVIGPSQLISAVGDKLYNVSGTLVGKETLQTDRGPLEAEHYRLSGDLERDLWYDTYGRLLRVRFESRGSEIEYRLK